MNGAKKMETFFQTSDASPLKPSQMYDLGATRIAPTAPLFLPQQPSSSSAAPPAAPVTLPPSAPMTLNVSAAPIAAPVALPAPQAPVIMSCEFLLFLLSNLSLSENFGVFLVRTLFSTVK